MGPGPKLALLAGAAAIAITTVASTALAQQKVTGPVAVYWMSAQTQTGFGMPAMGGGGGRPDTGAMMRAMMGGGGASKTLQLQLGSGQTNPAPAADHLPPSGLQAGPALPLLTPKPVQTQREEPREYDVPEQYQKPKGKMLIFWGCGERARPGQPYVIDFAKMASGQQNPATLFKGIDYRPMQPPSVQRNRTYGEWPNEKTRDLVPSNGSLVGAHTIRGNYSPEINFTLEEDQDFLGPINLTTNAKAPGGWVNLGWNLVGNAQAYYATAMGGDGDTVVMWTSSETQAAGFSNPDFLSQSDINRLVANKTLMGPAQKTCAVPKEVLDAAPSAIAQLVAYGGEANFVYPPRPQDPKVTWNQQWAVKVRYRSATGGILGQEMPNMGGGGRGGRAGMPGAPAQQPQQQPPKPPSASDILRQGILGGLPFPRR
ncbi:hypothetical protein [Phenylobacterium sp. CCH9-H3]|uniref:hypothetical protein n=3 Tax=unclassified Phenylobacterium TaxID=2640670 RepID=UPI00083ACC16|nr:hypothetical protein [Phenylobacterium sp. CCH9-H3]